MKTSKILSAILISLTFWSCKESKIGPEESQILLDQYTLAYNVLINDSTDNYEVFTMNLDGSDKKNITNLSGLEWTYYSFLDKIYFISDQDTCQRCAYFLYQTNYKGENPKKISDIPLADSWMSSRKNDSEFIVKPNSKMDSAFYILDMSGKLIQRIETQLPNFSDPLFINKGSRIAFRGGTRKSKRDPGYQEEIYLINSDGTGLKQLTQYPANDSTAPWFAYKAGPPKLQPKENFISYQSYQDGKYSLYAISLDGSKQWKLTDNKGNEGWHDWSPDGKYLAIELFDQDQTQFHIGIMNWETKEMKILTDTTYKYQQAPNFVLKND